MIHMNDKIKNYIKMERNQGSYFQRNDGNSILEALAILFDDHGSSANWFIEELLDPNSRGISGEWMRLKFKGDKVVVTPTELMYPREKPEDPEDYAIEIDRDVLLRLANEWQNLVRQKAPVIFIVQRDDELFVTDTLPEGME